jgi:hypothetical protein
MAEPIGETKPVTEPLGLRPLVIVGWDDQNRLHAWASELCAQQITTRLRREILSAAEDIMRDLQRPRG